MLTGPVPFPPPRIIGHRGAAASAPENTLAGFRRAKTLGARWVEFDVQATRDGCAILLHDARLERTTNGRGLVGDLSLSEIASLDAGSWFGRAFAGEKVPRLADVLRLLDELELGAVIEVKSPPGDGVRAMRATLAALDEAPPARPPILSSFDEPALELAAKEAGQFDRALIVNSVPRDWHARAERLGCSALHAGERALDAPTVEAVSGRLALRAYTVNAPERARTLFGWGVAAVFTDCPDVILCSFGQGSGAPAAPGLRGSIKK